ncbi:MAG: DUF1707 SHOCT-like domain-containing protein [Thermoleophilaceae bacterium]
MLVTSCHKVSALLVSDQEREYTVGLLRRHWLTGRLTAEEFEQRVGEAWQARSAQDLWQALRWLPVDAAPAAARPAGSAVCSLVLGLLGLIVLIGSLGFLFVIALPLSVTAWALGRQARRSGGCVAPGVAIAGEVIGVTGTGLSLVWLAGCAALLA